MSERIYQLIEELASKDGLSIEEYTELIIEVFSKIYCQGENFGSKLEFDISFEEKKLKIYRSYEIKDTVNNPSREIGKDIYLTKSNGEIKDGHFLLPIDLKNLSYNFNYKLQKEFQHYLLKKREQKNLLLKDENYLRELFKLEVPEIKDGIVKIKAILRSSGKFSKVIVSTFDSNVDPVGSCLGKGGIRIKTIQKNMGREWISVMPWQGNEKESVKLLLKPIRVISWLEEKAKITVVIPDKQIKSTKLLIEKELIEKISDFLGKEIFIKSLEEMQGKVIIWNGDLTLDEYERNYKN